MPTPYEFGRLIREKSAKGAAPATVLGHVGKYVPRYAAVGAGLGAYQAPQGHKLEGAARGAGRGAGTAIGGLAGGLAGVGLGLGGAMVGMPSAVILSQKYPRMATALMHASMHAPAIGGTAGMGLGSYAGYNAAGAMMGRPSYEAAAAPSAAAAKTAAEKVARGLITDIALYSNPFTGVPTAAYDTYNHLRNGRYLNAVGSVAAGGLSLAGGGMLGSGMKGMGLKALQAGRSLGTKTMLGGGLATAGKALATGGRGDGAAAAPMTRAFQGMNSAASGVAQKVLPMRAGATFSKAPVQAATNWMGKNPIEAGAMFLHNSNSQPTPPGGPQLRAR